MRIDAAVLDHGLAPRPPLEAPAYRSASASTAWRGVRVADLGARRADGGPLAPIVQSALAAAGLIEARAPSPALEPRLVLDMLVAVAEAAHRGRASGSMLARDLAADLAPGRERCAQDFVAASVALLREAEQGAPVSGAAVREAAARLSGGEATPARAERWLDLGA